MSQFSAYVITEPCVGVKNAACLEVCPVDCIHTAPGEDQYYIDPSVCIACEQCALVCPVEAIFLDVNVPTQWRSYLEKNADFYRRTKGEPMPVPVERAMTMIQAGHAKALELDIAVSVAVVDEDNGVVVLWMNFGHTGNSYGEGNSLVTFEAFKVWGGEIHAVNAFFKGLPVGTSRFWPTSDPTSR